jgi:hypothetical protein
MPDAFARGRLGGFSFQAGERFGGLMRPLLLKAEGAVRLIWTSNVSQSDTDHPSRRCASAFGRASFGLRRYSNFAECVLDVLAGHDLNAAYHDETKTVCDRDDESHEILLNHSPTSSSAVDFPASFCHEGCHDSS